MDVRGAIGAGELVNGSLELELDELELDELELELEVVDGPLAQQLFPSIPPGEPVSPGPHSGSSHKQPESQQ